MQISFHCLIKAYLILLYFTFFLALQIVYFSPDLYPQNHPDLLKAQLKVREKVLLNHIRHCTVFLDICYCTLNRLQYSVTTTFKSTKILCGLL